MSDEGGIEERCVVLRNFSADVPESEVRSCLDVHGKHNLYTHLDKYQIQDDSVLWIVLFKSSKDATVCRNELAWAWRYKEKTCAVIADHCSECLIPEQWKTQAANMAALEDENKKDSMATSVIPLLSLLDQPRSFSPFSSIKSEITDSGLEDPDNLCLPNLSGMTLSVGSMMTSDMSLGFNIDNTNGNDKTKTGGHANESDDRGLAGNGLAGLEPKEIEPTKHTKMLTENEQNSIKLKDKTVGDNQIMTKDRTDSEVDKRAGVISPIVLEKLNNANKSGTIRSVISDELFGSGPEREEIRVVNQSPLTDDDDDVVENKKSTDTIDSDKLFGSNPEGDAASRDSPIAGEHTGQTNTENEIDENRWKNYKAPFNESVRSADLFGPGDSEVDAANDNKTGNNEPKEVNNGNLNDICTQIKLLSVNTWNDSVDSNELYESSNSDKLDSNDSAALLFEQYKDKAVPVNHTNKMEAGTGNEPDLQADHGRVNHPSKTQGNPSQQEASISGDKGHQTATAPTNVPPSTGLSKVLQGFHIPSIVPIHYHPPAMYPSQISNLMGGYSMAHALPGVHQTGPSVVQQPYPPQAYFYPYSTNTLMMPQPMMLTQNSTYNPQNFTIMHQTGYLAHGPPFNNTPQPVSSSKPEKSITTTIQPSANQNQATIGAVKTPETEVLTNQNEASTDTDKSGMTGPAKPSSASDNTRQPSKLHNQKPSQTLKKNNKDIKVKTASKTGTVKKSTSVKIPKESSKTYEVLNAETKGGHNYEALGSVMADAKGAKGRKATLNVFSLEDDDEHEQEVTEPYDHCNKCLRVTGFPDNTEEEAVMLFFESKRYSGGGPVNKLVYRKEKKEAVVEFKNMKDASEVLSRCQPSGHLRYKTDVKLAVYEYSPPPLEPLKLFVHGIADETTDSMMMMFIECAKKCPTPKKISRGLTPGTAMIEFEEKPNLKELQVFCKNRSIDGHYWELSEVERSSKVKVTGITELTSGQTVELYFENRQRSDGGDVEAVDRHFEDNTFIVTFKDYKAAERVCVAEKEHMIGGQGLHVELYYPCMDRDPSSQPTLPPPVVVQYLDTYKVRFLEKSPVYHARVTSTLAEIHGAPEWTKDEDNDDILQVTCTVDVNQREARKQINQWNQLANSCLTWANNELVVNRDIEFVVEIWNQLKVSLGTINVPDPNLVCVFKEKDVGITVVGEKQAVEDLSKEIINIITMLEKDLEQEKQQVTKVVQLKQYELTLVRSCKLEQQLKKKNVDIKIDGEKKQIVIKGNRKIVDEIYDKVRVTLKSFVRQEVKGYTRLGTNLLFMKETRDYVKKFLIQKHIIGVWDVFKGTQLFMYSASEMELKQAVEILQQRLKEFTVDIGRFAVDALKSNFERSELNRLQVQNPGQLKISIAEFDVHVATIDSLEDRVRVELDKFRDLHQRVTELLKVDHSKFRYLLTFKGRVIDDIKQQFAHQRVTVKDNRERYAFEISGKKDCCIRAIDKLQQVLDHITQCTETFHWTGFGDFLTSQKGKDMLNSIELTNKCVLEYRAGHQDRKNRDGGSRDRQSDTRPRKDNLRQALNYKLRNCKVCYVTGDVLDVQTDYLVVPTDRNLSNTTRIGMKVVDKGGQSIHNDLKNMKDQHSSEIREGTVVRIPAGRLRFQSILYAVVPEVRGPRGSDLECLQKTICTCLEMANTNGCSSIAFPPIGMGKFGFSVQDVAQRMTKGITQYLDTGDNKLERIVICNYDEGSADDFQTALDDCGAVMMRHRGGDRADAGGDGAGNYTRPNIPIQIVTSSIVDQKVDVIVNSTNTDLDLSFGNVARQLLKAAGDSLQDECKSKYPTGIRVGELAVTGAGGNLNCKALYHGALQRWDSEFGQAQRGLEVFVYKCLETADKANHTSIAFPALGTGACQFPADVAASTMFDIVEEYNTKNPDNKLEKVKFVIWNGDSATLKAFQDEDVARQQRHRVKRGRSSMNPYIHDDWRNSDEGGFKATIGNFMLNVIQGNITQQTHAVIVNSIVENLDLNLGLVSRAILSAAGHTIQYECGKPESKDKLMKDGLVVTGPGKLLCKSIVHLRSRTTESNWQDTIVKCLKTVDGLGHNSVAFPALGTGGRGFKAETMAKVFYNAIKQYSGSGKTKGCLKCITIVVYERYMVQAFTSELIRCIECRAKKPANLRERIQNLFPYGQVSQSKESVTVFIYADSIHHGEKIKEEIRAIRTTDEVFFSKTLLNHLNDKQLAKLEGIFRSVEFCRVEKLKDRFKLEGYGRAVSNVRRKITDYMYTLNQEFEQYQRAQQIKQAKQAKSAVSLPANWSKMSLVDKTKTEILPPNHPEFVKVSGLFTTQAGLTLANIVQIERVQNPTLYTQYFAKKKQMENAGQTNVERCLWHGTHGGYAVTQNINEKGFDRNFNSGASHGSGVYFAVSARMSASGYARPDPTTGNKYIYYANVLTGDFCVGQHSIRRPPAKNAANPLVTYDSTTDNVTAPNFFVIFHDAQAYPSYLITFR